jgi:REP-associated tyrosine transposase
LVFLTACKKNRRPWLAQTEPHAILLEVWRSLLHWKVSRYVLMPDHLHLFAWPSSGRMDFDRWVTAWKAEFSRIAANRALRWQARCFHHRIRSWESAEAKYRYMLNNPVRQGLVSSAEEWPYQGELFPTKDWW